MEPYRDAPQRALRNRIYHQKDHYAYPSIITSNVADLHMQRGLPFFRNPFTNNRGTYSNRKIQSQALTELVKGFLKLSQKTNQSPESYQKLVRSLSMHNYSYGFLKRNLRKQKMVEANR